MKVTSSRFTLPTPPLRPKAALVASALIASMGCLAGAPPEETPEDPRCSVHYCTRPINQNPPPAQDSVDFPHGFEDFSFHQPFWGTQDTDVHVRVQLFDGTDHATRAALANYVFGQARACGPLVGVEGVRSYNHFKFNITADGRCHEDAGCSTPDGIYLKINPDILRDAAASSPICHDNLIAHEVAHSTGEESFAQRYYVFCASGDQPCQDTFFRTFQLYEEGRATFQADRVAAYQYNIIGTTNVDFPRLQASSGMINGQSLFSICLDGDNSSCTQATPADRFDCCSSLYSGISSLVPFTIQGREQQINLQLIYSDGREDPEDRYYPRIYVRASLDGVTETRAVQFETIAQAQAPSQIGLGDIVFDHVSHPDRSDRLYFFEGRTEGRTTLECHDPASGQPADGNYVRGFIVDSGETSPVTVWTGLRFSYGFSPSNPTDNNYYVGYCFWTHIGRVYGQERLNSLLRLFQAPIHPELSCYNSLLLMMAQALGIPADNATRVEQFRDELRMFGMNTNDMERGYTLQNCAD